MRRSKIHNYWKKIKFEYGQWNHRRTKRKRERVFDNWSNRFLNSDARVLLGAHFHLQGGVRNHLLSIKEYSKQNVLLVPEEQDLQRFGAAPFSENLDKFLELPPPKNAIAVHTHVLPWLIDWSMAKIQTHQLRWIHTHHLFYYPESGRTGIEPWQEALNQAMVKGAQACDLCICVNRWEQEVLKKEYKTDSTYVPNGVDRRLCDSANGNRFINKYGVPSDFVLWVGRHDPVKNPGDFVQLAKLSPTLKFVMVGGVTRETIESFYNLIPPPNLILLPHLSRLDVLDAIAASRVLVVTSFREGLPTLVLEAMTLQKQIVVPNEAGCLDATNGDECARVYEHGNLDQLAKRVRDAYEDRPPRSDARNRIMKEFDWEIIASRLDRIYQGETD